MLALCGDDEITVDAVVSGLAGAESKVLDQVLTSKSEAKSADAVAMLAGAIARSKDAAGATKLFAAAGEPSRPAWQRRALLAGADSGLTRMTRFGPAQGGEPSLSLAAEPASLTALAAGSGELAELATEIVGKIDWPGKPAPVDQGPKLTAEELAHVAAGGEVYTNFCAGCHLANGQGNQGGATNLTASKLVVGNPSAAMRVVLGGKDGDVGLMPPLGSALNDEQIAQVVSYIRNSWGNAAVPIGARDVQETRGVTSLRKTPWSNEELEPMLPRPYRRAPGPIQSRSNVERD